MTPGSDTSLVSSWVPSPNFEPRKGGRGIDLLLLHYTACPTAQDALDILISAESKVSSHYLIDEDGTVTQMVAEAERAWHAGLSHWAGETDINSCSIGIEIQNQGELADLPDFPDVQMQAVEALCLDIVKRNNIPSHRVLAHSDVAPGRKIDPGEKFDWQRLHQNGLGLWITPEPIRDASILQSGDSGEEVEQLQKNLQLLGYGLEITGNYENKTENIVSSFQRHWRPARIDGCADYSTHITLERLLATAIKQ